MSEQRDVPSEQQAVRSQGQDGASRQPDAPGEQPDPVSGQQAAAGGRAGSASGGPGRPEGGGPARVEVLGIERLYDGFFKLERATVRHERFDGRMSEPQAILHFDRGDAVGVLLHDPRLDAVCLTRQFRYPAWVRGGPGWILDVAAGILEPGEAPEATAEREALEETGLSLQRLTPILTFYPSPGGCSERIFLYLGEVDLGSRLPAGAPGPVTWRGGVDESEDIEVVAAPRRVAMEWLAAGGLVEPKTVIALLWLERRIGPPR